MDEKVKLLIQIDLVKSIIDKTKDYGSPEQPVTISIFKEILRDVLTDKQVELVNL